MSDTYTIFVGERAWRIGQLRQGELRFEIIAQDDPTDVAAAAQQTRTTLEAMGYGDEPVVLAMDSSWCLSAAINTQDIERSGRRRAMAFRLEEHLPISAEDFVADFFEADAGEALGVCCELSRLRAVVDTLVGAGVPVWHICPAAFLAGAHAAEQQDQADAVLLDGDGDRGAFDLIELHHARPVRWWWLADDADAVRARLDAIEVSPEAPLKVAVIGGRRTEALAKANGRIDRLDIDRIDRDAAAVHAAARLVAQTASPWIDLRRDALAGPDRYATYRKPLIALVGAVVLLVVGVIVAMQWRGRAYAGLAERFRDQQVAVFAQALPEQASRPPANIRGRLKSEATKLAGLGGQVGDDADVATLRPRSALAHLHAVLGALPTDLRLRVLDLSIQPDLVRLDGEARTHVEAERIATALRNTGEYEVDPPRTRALREQGVSFLFNARPRQAGGGS